uniref:Uncharacterized protein n=1 Tax=Aegilops tauschii subsp. strangulata TaxID=200361 RepID=A0A453DSB0_AEGTS
MVTQTMNYRLLTYLVVLFFSKLKYIYVTSYPHGTQLIHKGCGFAGPTKVLLDHFTTQHKCPSTTLPDSGTLSLCLQPGLHVVKCTGNSYFFLLSMASEPYGHAISAVCVQPNMTESKFTCNMSYDCITTGCCGSASCHIRSSSLSDGLPTVYDLILPKGKVFDDANGIMLRASIHHQPLSLSRSCFQGNGLTPAFHETPDTYHDVMVMRRIIHLYVSADPVFEERPRLLLFNEVPILMMMMMMMMMLMNGLRG